MTLQMSSENHGLHCRLLKQEWAGPPQETSKGEDTKILQVIKLHEELNQKRFPTDLGCQSIQSIFYQPNLNLFQDQNLTKTTVYFIKTYLQCVEILFHKKITFYIPSISEFPSSSAGTVSFLWQRGSCLQSCHFWIILWFYLQIL